MSTTPNPSRPFKAVAAAVVAALTALGAYVDVLPQWVVIVVAVVVAGLVTFTVPAD